MSEKFKTITPAKGWRPDSWQQHDAGQQANYPDQIAFRHAQGRLATMPPLVTSWEILALKQQIAEAQAGKRFVLQGGDCAELFDDCEPNIIANRLKVLLQMSLVMLHGMEKPVVRIGRFAGQYAKPRSSDTETRDGVTLPSYRGDLVNAPAFTEAARTPDPERMLRAHASSAMTMNFVRALVDGGFADLHHPEYWNLGWLEHSPLADEFERIAESIGHSVRFMETITGQQPGSLRRVDFFTSHEALHLNYEQALTRRVPRQWGWFNLSTHFPWIGMRTAELEGAHVELFRGVRNPIGIKVGPGMSANWLKGLIQTLNPDDEPGRLVLIHRMGAAQVADRLPPLIEAARSTGSPVLWICDPMHGNTEKTDNGYKTRRFANIVSEVEQSFDIHAACGSRLGGVHLELTGENVTECIGGARDLAEHDLSRAYKTTVDPRLNYEQALELSMRIVGKHRSLGTP
ncbi:class II 3-deoxy-7-phosphoheptulonate synthase [Wenzhouxiangella sp. EGI_FJ10409]|uniref:class II 3-deoxy-7-phosphoheptulonate synthase n=1 Tax=Wenzhouxiangella sp. EGI_FJ10409 TaxID=3243767 RepID=UPI0035DC58F2